MKQEKINQLKELPAKVQEDVKETLKAWQGCYVQQNETTGEYKVTVGVSLTAAYNPWKTIASFENTDIYTNEEIKRYANEVWGKCNMSDW